MKNCDKIKKRFSRKIDLVRIERVKIDMKLKNWIFLVGCVLPFFLLGACSSNKQNKGMKDASLAKEKEVEKKIIYTTFIPVTDITKTIVGDKMEVKTIIGVGDEPHSFELKAADMKAVTEADLIVYNGAGMEGFIPDLMNVVGDETKFLDLSQGLTLLETKSDLGADHHDSVNPHTWLSIRNAIEQLDTVYRKLASIDPENEAYYKKNLEESQAKFRLLDKKFEEELAKVEGEKYFVVSHAAFNYLANDYGLKQVAVTGISPEDEPSAKQLKDIADFVGKHGITTIFFEGKATPKVAETLAKTTGTKTATLYTMENLTEEESKLGYVELMERNLSALMESFHE